MSSQFESANWCGLYWTPFVPLSRTQRSLKLPSGAGLYRIRVVGQDALAYIGQTGRNLRERVNCLNVGVHAVDMPYNDPHTAACRLWSLRIELEYQFEVSVAELNADKLSLMAYECYLIWKYRTEAGSSTLCNFGRMHPQYIPSQNRSKNKRGYRLPDGECNPRCAQSIPPLVATSTFESQEWMGIGWSAATPLSTTGTSVAPSASGVYRLLTQDLSEIVYIGESDNLRSRLASHCRASVRAWPIMFAFARTPDALAKCQRLEIENDLIGAYFEERRSAPRWQFAALPLRTKA
jgi:hypothetical protein